MWGQTAKQAELARELLEASDAHRKHETRCVGQVSLRCFLHMIP